MDRIPINSLQTFIELTGWLDDAEIVEAIRQLTAAQQEMGVSKVTCADPGTARAMVDEPALEQILEEGADIHGIATDREISNVISFNSPTDTGSVQSETIRSLRHRVDDWVSHRLLDTFEAPYPLEVSRSGHFWYPPGGYMGWHTNSAAPGWRIYITHAREPGKSFFRYREPDTGNVITSMDDEWNVRIFRIDPAVPLWHAVYSDTDRFSLGYIVRRRRWYRPVTRKIRRMLGR
jgi:hypothetical protein